MGRGTEGEVTEEISVVKREETMEMSGIKLAEREEIKK